MGSFLDPIGSAVLTLIGYKRTDKQSMYIEAMQTAKIKFYFSFRPKYSDCIISSSRNNITLRTPV